MRSALALFLALLAGCGAAEPEGVVEWVIERRGRTPLQIQADLDVMAENGFRVRDDDQLETSGHYILFARWLPVSQKPDLIQRTRAGLEAARKAHGGT